MRASISWITFPKNARWNCKEFPKRNFASHFCLVNFAIQFATQSFQALKQHDREVMTQSCSCQYYVFSRECGDNLLLPVKSWFYHLFKLSIEKKDNMKEWLYFKLTLTKT